jgi:outer membrane protein assembly factor BamD (BamD/ComL family)
MNNRFIFAALILAVTLTSCKPSREKSVSEIRGMEKKLYEQPSFTYNKPRGDSLLRMYDDFVSRFPKDTLAPVFLFRAANLSISAGDGNKALSLLDRFATQFPDHPKVPVCFFFKGYVYENILKNLDKAKESYLIYIEKYPNDVFVKDARMAIQNLGKTPDQIVREFEEQRRQDSIRRADSLAAVRPKRIRS